MLDALSQLAPLPSLVPFDAPIASLLTNLLPSLVAQASPAAGSTWLPGFLSTWTWEEWLLLLGVPLVCVLGVLLTAVLLPGTWLIVAAGLGVAIWRPDLLPWWVVVIMVLLALLAEGIEFLASALGAGAAGASKKGAAGALIGALAGAIVGLAFLPPIGPIVGGALGAAGGTIIAERNFAQRSWEESSKAAVGAAVGRLVATLAKVLIAGVIGVVLVLGVVL